MFEVNFFEKKQKNFLPYLLSGIFLFFILLIGVYFFFMQLYYTNSEKTNQEWLQTKEEQLIISQQMQQYDQLTKQVSQNKAAFETKQYPMAFLTKDVLKQVPNGEQQVTIFNKNETNQVTLVLEGLTVKELSETIEKFNARTYISNVQFIRMENQPDGASSVIELWLEIDESALEEEILL